MSFIDLLLMSLNNLLKRKLRSGLTLLGIILGAMSVSITLAIGNAIKSNNQKVLDSKGDLKNISVSVNNMLNNTKKDKDKVYLDDSAIKNLKNIDGVNGVWAELNIDRNIVLLAGKNNKYVLDNLKGVFLDDIDKFGYKILSGSLPTQKSLDNQKYIQVLAGQYFEYNFRKQNIRNWNKSSRYYNSPIEQYSREKYGYDQDSFVLKPPFVNYQKDDMYLGIRLSETQNNSDIEFSDLMTGKSDTEYQNNKKPKYKTYKLNVAGRLDWEAVKDHNNWQVQSYSSTGILIDVDLAKEIINQYRKLNHITQNTSSFMGDLDENAPLFTYHNVVVNVKDINLVEKVSQKIGNLGFSPSNQIEEVEKEKARTSSNQLVLGVLGAITLFVASLSVANTMITSMYERTKEIGVMKVIGCKVGNIKIIFLIESAILGLLGGSIGMAITYYLSNFMNNITNVSDISELTGVAELLATYMSMMQYDSYATVKLDIALIEPSLWLYIISGSVLVTMIAAYIPARKAARISALTSIKEE
ncbi:MAG: ABC transporter permease [Oscillospiraceae bacterium]|nr:ABC transporter permease [Oscillospiraceae bacterium]